MNKEKKFRGAAGFVSLVADYFDSYLPTSGEIADIESLCVFLGISRRELRNLEHDRHYEEAIALAKTRIASRKKQLAMTGKIPPTVFSFDFRNNHDYTDKGDDNSEPVSIVLEGKAKQWGK